jgi:hypothetical protein
MGASPPESRELQIELAEPPELFEPRRADVVGGAPPIPPGIDRLRRELGSGSLPTRIAILLPREHVTPPIERGVKEALLGYCELGIDRVERDLKAIHRDGRQALVLGVIILATSLALSQVALHTGLPSGIKDFFGNGLLLVAAWVGAWYPLDTLIYAGRPHRIERKVLRTIQGLEIAVRPADGASAA